MTQVAIFYYSLTGNTEAAARAVADGLAPGATPHLIRVHAAEPRWQLRVPFAPMWRTFFATLRPTTLGEHVAITTEPAEWPASDAVIVGSSTWWNRPCLPIQSLIGSVRFRDYVRGKPVGVFAACRGFFRTNLHELGRAMADAGARVVARDRFTYTGGVIATFLAFFAFLKFGVARTRWLGARLAPYGFTPATLARARGFGAGFPVRAAAGVVAPVGSPALVTAVRGVMLGLAVFDLGLAIAFTLLSARAVPAIAPAAFAEPQFFQRCVGLFLLQYVFIQYLGFRDPRTWATALTMTIAVRATFAVLYVAQLVLWGPPFTVLHGLFAASAVLDAATTVFLVIAMARLDLGLFQGDAALPPGTPTSRFLRGMLRLLAAAELGIGLAWLTAPKLFCRMFELAYVVDPFWTRATGVFLINIALIQYLAARDPAKYRSAALTSGLFRALWPVLYWVTAAHGEGNPLFRGSILFFSGFDLISCVVIFALVRRGGAASAIDGRGSPAIEAS